MKKLLAFFFLCFMLIFLVWDSYAQCTVKKRVYAKTQKFKGTGVIGILPGYINNSSNSVNEDPYSYSTLNVPIGLDIPFVGILNSSATQFLEFKNGTNFISTNTPVTIKLDLPKSLLGVLSSIEIQPFKDLTGSATNGSATAVGAAYSSSSLASLINGSGLVEVTITPTVQYQGIWIKLKSTLSLGLSLDVYHAYILEDHSSPTIDCNKAIDILHGVKAGALGGLLNATGTVTNPYHAIDNDLTSFAELNLGLQVLSEVFETVIFSTPSQKNDVVEIILQKSDGSLLDLDLLTNFSIQPYLGTNTAGSSLTNTSNFLSLSLLSGASGNAKYLLRARVPEIFDKVEIKMGGVAGILSSLKIYDVKKKVSPAILLNGVEIKNTTLCEDENITLNVDPQLCTTYKWYDVAIAGIALQTGTTFTANNVSTTKTYYLEAIRASACTPEERVPFTIDVNPAPAITLGPMPEVCESIIQSKLIFSSPLNSPTTYKIIWNQPAIDAGFTNTEQNLPNNSEIEIPIPYNTVSAIYSGILTVKNANNCISKPKNIQITIQQTPTAPNVNIQTHSQY